VIRDSARSSSVAALSVPGLALLLLLSALLVGIGAGPARAHAELEGSTPADGAVLTAPPKTIELVFGEDIIEAGMQVVAQDDSGTLVALPKATAVGPKVSVGWPASAAAGGYRVSYRVTSQDGHPIDGTISFSYGAASASPSAGAGSATSSGGATAGSQVGGTATPIASGSPTTGQPTAASPSPTSADAQADGRSQWWIIAILVVLGVIIGAVIARVLNQRRARNS
jgi:methionine-rich copper-binding protein CopC